MHEELNWLNPYEIFNDDPEQYRFITNCNVVYIAYFTNSKGYFNLYPEFNEEILSFAFEPDGETREALYLGVNVSRVLAQSHDRRIMDTILFILIHFFEKNPAKSLIIICESSDNLERCRNRLFNRWFKKIKTIPGLVICKYDLMISDEGYASIFVHSQNRYHDKIRDAFYDIPNRLIELK